MGIVRKCWLHAQNKDGTVDGGLEICFGIGLRVLLLFVFVFGVSYCTGSFRGVLVEPLVHVICYFSISNISLFDR